MPTVFILSILLCLTACNGQSSAVQRSQPLEFKQTFTFNGKTIRVAVLDTPAKREQGLMWVTSLPKDYGAFFVFETEEEVGFWMKNTLLPLDIFFFDKNYQLIKVIEAAQPCLKSCSIYKVSKVKYVLELTARNINK